MSVLRITSELFIMITRHTSIELDFSTKQAEKLKSCEMKVDSLEQGDTTYFDNTYILNQEFKASIQPNL